MRKKTFLFIAKLGIVVAIFAYLVHRATKGSAFRDLDARSIDWLYLLLGFAFNLLATAATLVRWRALVEALGSKLPLSEALRYGFIGLLFNLSPLGIAGGDAVKAGLLVKNKRAPLDKALAGVVMDRVVGLYAMFVLGLIVVFATGFYANRSPVAQIATRGLVATTIATSVFLGIALTPSSKRNLRLTVAAATPLIGGALKKLTASTLIYSARKTVLFVSFLATLAIHSFFAVSLYFIARGLYGAVPSLVDHLSIYCVGNLGSIVPLSAGPFEYLVDELYPLFAVVGGEPFDLGRGSVVGFAYRIAAALVSLVGMFAYRSSRSDVKEALNGND
ncbi:MAG: flippase-like domain-containing protein [Thermoguttaceae bacterium]|nr:flippase-like domain-containing protein [Thermoguttaceae bacterium]